MLFLLFSLNNQVWVRFIIGWLCFSWKNWGKRFIVCLCLGLDRGFRGEDLSSFIRNCACSFIGCCSLMIRLSKGRICCLKLLKLLMSTFVQTNTLRVSLSSWRLSPFFLIFFLSAIERKIPSDLNIWRLYWTGFRM